MLKIDRFVNKNAPIDYFKRIVLTKSIYHFGVNDDPCITFAHC
jgi:hypothetical protein